MRTHHETYIWNQEILHSLVGQWNSALPYHYQGHCIIVFSFLQMTLIMIYDVYVIQTSLNRARKPQFVVPWIRPRVRRTVMSNARSPRSACRQLTCRETDCWSIVARSRIIRCRCQTCRLVVTGQYKLGSKSNTFLLCWLLI